MAHFNKIFYKDYFDQVIKPPEVSQVAPPIIKKANEQDNNVYNDQSIQDSMTQLLHAVNSLKVYNNVDSKQNTKASLSKYLMTSANPQQPGISRFDQQTRVQDKSPKSSQKQLQTPSDISRNTMTSPISKSPLSFQQQVLKTRTSNSRNRSQSPLASTQTSVTPKKGFKNFLLPSNKAVNAKRSSSRTHTPKGDQQQVSDVIDRLFQNHKRTQENKEQQRLFKYQQEMEVLKDKPTINENSQRLVMKNVRKYQPIYSPERYNQEVNNVKLKREMAERKKALEDKEKEIAEMEEISKYMERSQDKKLDYNEFLRKYENQVKQWQAKQGMKQKFLTESQYLTTEENEHATFKPEINKKSKQMTSHVDRIENRLGKLKLQKQKKIELMKTQLQPSFTPRINSNTDKLLEDNRKRTNSNSPLIQIRQSSSCSNLKPLRQKDNMSPISKTSYINQDNTTSLTKKLDKTQSPPRRMISTLQSQDWNPLLAESINMKNTITPTKIIQCSPVSIQEPSTYKALIEQSNLKMQQLADDIQSSQQFQQPDPNVNTLSIMEQYNKLKEEMNNQLSKRSPIANAGRLSLDYTLKQQRIGPSHKPLNSFRASKARNDFTQSSINLNSRIMNRLVEQCQEFNTESSQLQSVSQSSDLHLKQFQAVTHGERVQTNQSVSKNSIDQIRESMQSLPFKEAQQILNSQSTNKVSELYRSSPSKITSSYRQSIQVQPMDTQEQASSKNQFVAFNSESFVINQTISSNQTADEKNKQFQLLQNLNPKTLEDMNMHQLNLRSQYRSSQGSQQMEYILSNIKDSIDVMTSRIRELEDSGNRTMSPEIMKQEIDKLKNLSPKLKIAQRQIEEVQSRDSSKVRERKSLPAESSFQVLTKQESVIKIQQCDTNDSPLSQEERKTPKHNFQMITEREQLKGRLENEGSPSRQVVTSRKPFTQLVQQSQDLQMFSSVDKTKDVNNTLGSNYKGGIDYSFRTDQSPVKPVEMSKVTEESELLTPNVSNFNNNAFNEVARYLDVKSQQLLQRSQHSASKLTRMGQSYSDLSADQKKEEIIRKLVQSNSNFKKSESLLSIPKEVLDEIDEYGLDSISILQIVLVQFQHLFKPKSPVKEKSKLSRIYAKTDYNIVKTRQNYLSGESPSKPKFL